MVHKTIIPPEFITKRTAKASRWPYVLAIVLLLLLDLGLGYILYQNLQPDGAKEPVSEQAVTAEDRLTQVSSSENQTKDSTGSEIEQVQSLADHFMQARLKRDFEAVKPYVSADFLEKYDQSTFAGASSPALDDYEITDINYIGSGTFRIIVETRWLLNGDDAGGKDWILVATKNKNDYRINDYSEK